MNNTLPSHEASSSPCPTALSLLEWKASWEASLVLSYHLAWGRGATIYWAFAIYTGHSAKHMSPLNIVDFSEKIKTISSTSMCHTQFQTCFNSTIPYINSKKCVCVCVCVCVLSHFSHIQLFATLWTVTCQAPLSMGILQTRTLEWIAMPFSRGSSQPRDRTQVSCIVGRFFTIWVSQEAYLSFPGSLLKPKILSIFLLRWN